MCKLKLAKAKLCKATAALAGAIVAFSTTANAQTAPCAAGAARSANRPNILFILVDDMGYGDLSLTGDTRAATPNIDLLAKRGLLMTQFYDPAPVCSSSRAGIFTGQYPATNHFVSVIKAGARDQILGQASQLAPTLPTTAKMLHDLGYGTAHFGKWHMSKGPRTLPATAYGFDETVTNEGGVGGPDAPNAKPATSKGKSDHTREFVDRTLDYICRNNSKPWFVQLWFNDVHAGWKPSADQYAKYADKVRGDDGPSGDDTRFLVVLSAMDEQVGRLYRALSDRGQLENTLIILTSDNGPTSFGKYYRPDGPPKNDPPGSTETAQGELRGRKASLYEGGIRQPMIVNWPGHTPRGVVDTTTVAHGGDLLPTLRDITGAAIAGRTDGVSLRNSWEGKPIAKRPPLFWVYGAFGPYSSTPRPGLTKDCSPNFAIRSGAFKLLADSDPTRSTLGRVELYDLSSDPLEKHNLVDKKPAVLNSMKQDLLGWIRALPTDYPIQKANPGGCAAASKQDDDE